MGKPSIIPFTARRERVAPWLRPTPFHLTEDGLNIVDDCRQTLERAATQRNRAMTLRMMEVSANTMLAIINGPPMEIGSLADGMIRAVWQVLDDSMAVEAMLTDDDLTRACTRQSLALAALLHHHFEGMGQ